MTESDGRAPRSAVTSDVIVVGGGISGLAVARRLAAARLRVRVLEASTRLGGKIAAGSLGGLRVDVGAESVLVRRPEAPRLISSLGLAERLVHPTDATPRIYVDGHAVRLPPSAMGVPGDVETLGALLTTAGLQRARREPSLPAPPLAGDVAVGSLVDERFGPEVTDRLLEPLLGGVYAGQARRLSFAAVNPALFANVRQGGPLSGHAGSTARTGDGPVFGGLQGGVAALVDALAGDLEDRGVAIDRAATVRGLTPTAAGYRLTVGPTPGPRSLQAAAVVLAIPAAPAGRLLAGLVGSAQRLAAIPYASMAVVTLAVRGVEPIGSGLLVPPGELATIKAVTHSSTKWAWVAEAARQAWGEGVHVIRASVGRLGEEHLLQVGDDQLIDRTMRELSGLPGWAGVQAMASTVQRWGGGLPQYQVGHVDLVARLRSELAERRGLAVCGAAYDGVGIAACLGSADAAASKIIDDLALTINEQEAGRA